MTRAIRAAFVRPPSTVTHEYSKPVECLALGYLCAALREAGHGAVLLDGLLWRWSVDETVERILAADVDVVGLSVAFQYLPPEIPDIAKRLRAAGFAGPILVGGHSVSFAADEVVLAHPEISAVIRGEGESAIAAIATKLAAGEDFRTAPGVTFAEDGRAVQRPVRREADLDALPRPARDAVPDILANDGLVAISTSRGCYARCTFCSVPRFFGLEAGHKHASGAWLSRSPACVVEEMRDLKNRFGIIELLFVDDEFFGGSEAGKRRAEELAARLIEADLGIRFAISCRAENVEEALFARLQAAGLSHVFIGIESGVAQALKLFAKSQTLDDSRRAIATVKRLGLSFQAGFMAFNHQSTLADIRLNLDFLEEIGEAKPYNFNTAAAPYRGTPLADKVARDGMMTDAARRTATGFLDLHVALAREAAAEIAAAAAPFIGAIAALQSAITYQWRRDVPARSDETRRVVNALEAAINAELFQMMRETVETLESQPAISGATLLDDLRARLGTWRKSKEGSVALVCAWVRQKEGEVRYWTQSDLIAHPQEHANA